MFLSGWSSPCMLVALLVSCSVPHPLSAELMTVEYYLAVMDEPGVSVPKGWQRGVYTTRVGVDLPILRSPEPAITVPVDRFVGGMIAGYERGGGSETSRGVVVGLFPSEEVQTTLEGFQIERGQLLLATADRRDLDLLHPPSSWSVAPGGVFRSDEEARAFYAATGISLQSIPLDEGAAAEWRRYFEEYAAAAAWHDRCHSGVLARGSGEEKLALGAPDCAAPPPRFPPWPPSRTDPCLAVRSEGQTVEGRREGPWMIYNEAGEQIRVEFYDGGRRTKVIDLRRCTDPAE